jgi:hypothetical protein
MARHVDWSVTVCLIGLGQEINDGEEGVAGWAQAISHLCARESISWNVYAPDFVFGVDSTTQTLGQLPAVARCVSENALHLDVPMRSFRSPKLGDWITALLECDHGYALSILKNLNYPLWVTRSLAKAKFWLHESTLGERRMGLLASSGARRLRADGVGEVLSATDGPAIAHWYLNPRGDIRSSFALEVPANEYTSQGLELDFACLCWGGDLIFRDNKLIARALAGNRWNEISDPKRASFIFNSYRVLLSRAREGLVIWIPKGDTDDHTRDPKELDSIANFLIRSGVRELM